MERWRRRALLATPVAGVIWVYGCVYDVPELATDASSEAQSDAGYDAPDLGTGLTESGLPCSCLNPLPAGFTAVEYAPNQQVPCTSGFDGSTDYVTNPTAPGTMCSCTCGAPTPSPTCSCAADPITFQLKDGFSNCALKGSTVQAINSADGGCYATSQALPDFFNHALLIDAGCTMIGGACAGPPTQTANLPPPTALNGRACATDTPTQGTCATSDVCFPLTAAPFQQCIASLTATTCPSGFPTPYRVGLAIADTRACTGTCTACTLEGKCSMELDLWSSSTSCGGFGSTSIKESCGSANWSGQTVTSASYTVTQNAVCGSPGFGLTGGLDVTSPLMICCR